MRDNQGTPSSDQRSRSKAARVLLCFIGTWLVLLLATFLLGELNLPYFGATVWDLGAVVLGLGLRGVVAAAKWSGANFVFASGALGVVWLISIHLRVRRAGTFVGSVLDGALTLLALGLLVVYFVYEDQVLPLHASFFYRVALYSAISVPSLGVVVAFWSFDKRLPTVAAEEGGLLFFTAVAMLAVAVATGQHGAEQDAAFFSYRVLNAVLHLVATFGAFIAAACFHEELDLQEAAASKPSARPAPAGSN